MSTPNISINPVATSNAAGSFNVDTSGYIQGMMLDDPAVRYALAGGVLASTETLPMWGGVAISELVPGGTGTPSTTLGTIVSRALTLASQSAGQLTGFSVFNQAYNMVNSPSSQVPLSMSGMSVNFLRLGSGARIAVAVAPTLISLKGQLITKNVSWDFAAQQLVPYAPAYAAVTISGATWAATAGGQTTYTVGTDLTAVLAANDVIDVSGVVSTGGTGVGFNGTFSVVSVPDSTHVVVTQIAASSPGTYSSGGTIAAGGGALPVEVLDVNTANSMTVSYNATTGLATWNRSGYAAIIRI